MNNTPYNNGKVKIGAHYIPRATKYCDDEGACFVQDLYFSSNPMRDPRKRFIRTVVTISTVVTLYILICAYVFW